MRKRVDTIDAPAPRPCGHPLVTYEGATAPACMWGATEELALPDSYCHAPEVAVMAAARSEHTTWQGTRRVIRPEMLDPDGEPWKRRPLWTTVAPEYAR